MHRWLVALALTSGSLAFAAPAQIIFGCQSVKARPGYQVQVLKAADGRKTAVVKSGGAELVRYAVTAKPASDQYEFLDTQTDGGNFTLRVAYAPGAVGRPLPGFFMAAAPKVRLIAAELTCRFR